MNLLEHPMLLLLLPASLLLAAAAGWLAVAEARPLRIWAQYPWRVFWSAYVLSLVTPPLQPGALYYGLTLTAAGLVVMYLSAVQGLRASWQRSPVVAVVILAVAFVFGVLGSIVRLQRTGEWHRLDLMAFLWFVAIAYWALMAVVADRVARRVGGEPRAGQTIES